MQTLSKTTAGTTCTVKWMSALPQVLRDYFESVHLKQGNRIHILQNNGLFIIVRSGDHRIGMDLHTADKIRV